ncbi:unnamed protein product [Alternaria alternata]
MAASSAKIPPYAAAVQKMVGSPAVRSGRGKDKKQRFRKSKVVLQREKLAGLRDKANRRVCSEVHAVSLPVVTKGPNARLPANARQQGNNNTTPTRMPTTSLTSQPNPPVMHPHILPLEQRTAEMQALQETMPDRQWVCTDDIHPLQQLLDAKRERKVTNEAVSKKQTTVKNKRRKRRKRRQVRQGAAQPVFIKTESIDDSPDTRRDSAYGNDIIDIVALCTYPGQTIKPSSFSGLFTLKRRIDAAVNDQGPLRNILRNLPRDITLTVERKEAIWVAQGKLNRIVDERRRGRRLQKLDRYLSSDRRIPVDRYVPGVPYNPIPHMLAMKVLSEVVA